MSLIKANLTRLFDDYPALGKTVQLVAVTKYASIDQMIEAYEWGIRDFGENKIQDFERKQALLPKTVVKSVRWHLLGHLQRNKVNKTVPNRFTMIHSVDSLALASKLSERNEASQIRQSVLLQVNLTREPQKTGFLEEDLLEVYPQLLTLHGITIEGLMTIGPHTQNPEESRSCFCHLHELREQLKDKFELPLPQLSMGMSEDFDHAIECGATIIRIGNRILTPP